MKPVFELHTIIRGKSALRAGGENAKDVYCALGHNQPLLLHREPNNPNDVNAVLVTDILGAKCGYVAREHAPEVSARLAKGDPLMARTNGQCMCVYRRIYIWLDAEERPAEESAFREVPASINQRDVPGVRTPEKVS